MQDVSHSSCAIASLAEEEEEKCALLAQYAASSGDLLPTFRDNLSVQSLGFKDLGWFTPEDGTDRWFETSAKHHCLLRNKPEERSSHLLRGGSLISRVEDEGYEAAHRCRTVTRNLLFEFPVPSAWLLFCACYEIDPLHKSSRSFSLIARLFIVNLNYSCRFTSPCSRRLS